MQTPSQTIPLDLTSTITKPSDEDIATTVPTRSSTSSSVTLVPAHSLQRIVRHDLKEEGNHVLAVTVTYTEPMKPGGGVGRIRTFRKLYQFVAQQCLTVRTKTGELPPLEPVDPKTGVRTRLMRVLLEAQLENMGETSVSLEVWRFILTVLKFTQQAYS
jgi:trafficking protein particle complex subunit 13